MSKDVIYAMAKLNLNSKARRWSFCERESLITFFLFPRATILIIMRFRYKQLTGLAYKAPRGALVAFNSIKYRGLARAAITSPRGSLSCDFTHTKLIP